MINMSVSLPILSIPQTGEGAHSQLVAGFTPEDFGKITEVARSL